MRAPLAATFGLLLAIDAVAAQRRPTVTPIADLLPATTSMDEYALTGDGNRVYYSTLKGEVRMYDRRSKASSKIADGGSIWDVSVAPNGSAVSFTMVGENDKGQYIWTVPLDTRTGLATGPQRRVSMFEGGVPSISPDGRMLAFARDDSAGQSLVVLPVTGGPERALASFHHGINRIRWTPDSRTLYFSTNPSRRDPSVRGTIQRISVNGGTPKVVAETGGGWPGLSPDGRTLAFSDTGFTHAYVLADTNGKRLTTIAAPPGLLLDNWLDGKTLLATRNRSPVRLRAFTIADGRSRLIMDTVDGVSSASWSKDGTRIAFGVSIHQSHRLVTIDASGRTATIIPVKQPIGGISRWSPDGRWVLDHNTANSNAVSAVELATGKEIELTKSTGGLPAFWTPDSRRVVVGSVSPPGSAARTFTVKEMDLAGNARVLREVTLAGDRTVVFWPISPNTALVNRGVDQPFTAEPISGVGTPISVLPASNSFVALFHPIVSRDGKWVALRRNPQTMDNTKMSIIEVAALDGSSRKTITLPFYAAPGPHAQFLPGNKQLIVAEYPSPSREYDVYLVTIATGESKKLFTIRRLGGQIPFDVSPDGRTILYINRDELPASYASVDISRLLPKP